MNDNGLMDRIYEAAFNPEEWVPVIDSLAALSGSAAGQLLVFRDN